MCDLIDIKSGCRETASDDRFAHIGGRVTNAKLAARIIKHRSPYGAGDFRYTGCYPGAKTATQAPCREAH
jgi:hypothetical protein